MCICAHSCIYLHMYMCKQVFINLSNKHLLSFCYVPGTVLNTGYPIVKKTDSVSVFMKTILSWGRQKGKKDTHK